MTSSAAAWAVRRSISPPAYLGLQISLSFNPSLASFRAARTFTTTWPRENKPRRPSSAVISSTKKANENQRIPSPSKSKVYPTSASIRAQQSHHDHQKLQSADQQVEPSNAAPKDHLLGSEDLSRNAPISGHSSNMPEDVSDAPVPTAAIPRQPTLSSFAHVDYVKQLSNLTSPVCIYQAPSQRRFSVVCYGSMLFFVAVAKFNYNSIIMLAADNTWAYAWVGIICSMYVALSFYCGLAPQKMIRSVYAVPAAGRTSGPMLEVTLKPILPFTKATPIPLAAADLTRDSVVASMVEQRLAVEAEERLRFTWGKGFFRTMRGVLFDVVNMFTRKNLVYVSLPRAGQCKIELPGAVNLGRGHALEQLIHMDASKKMLFRRMISQ